MKRFLIGIFLLSASTQSYAASTSLIVKILQCESSFNSTAIGDHGLAYGIAQFHKDTFYEFAQQAEWRMRKAKMWPPKWHNAAQQIFLLNWGLDHGYANRWTCYKIIRRRR